MLVAPAPVAAHTAFVTTDLEGTWHVHVLSAAGIDGVPGSTLHGLVTFDASGAVAGGALVRADGSDIPLSDGAVSVTTDGVVTGRLATGGSTDARRTAELIDARMLADRRTVIGVLTGGDLGAIPGPDVGLFTLIKAAEDAGTDDDLTGAWRYHELRMPAALGVAPAWVVGDLAFDPATPGSVTGGTLRVSDGTTGTPAGAFAVDDAGGVDGTLTGAGDAVELSGRLTAAGDLVAANTSVGLSAARGLALVTKVPAATAFVPADLRGAWRVHALGLDVADGNRGAFHRGTLLFDAKGALGRSALIDSAGAATTLTAGTLTVHGPTGRVTGTLTGTSAGTSLEIDGTLQGDRSTLVGVATLRAGARQQRGLLALVRAVSVVHFVAPAYSVVEGGSAQITLRREGDTTQPVSVRVAAFGAGTFGNKTFTAQFGATVASVTVPIVTVNDGLVDGTQIVALELRDPIGSAVLGDPAAATLSITDDDLPGTIRFETGTATIAEGSSGTVKVLRSGSRLGGSVSVDVEVVPGSATPGQHFELTNGTTLRFAAGATSPNPPLVVKARDDALDEPDRTFVLRLRNPTRGATLGTPDSITVTLKDNDTGGALGFERAAFAVSEGNGSATIVVTRAGGAAVVTVRYETQDGTGRAGLDYQATSGTLTFDAGVLRRTFTVPVTNTPLAEGDRTVRLILSEPGGGGTLGARREAELVILDDETGFRFSAPAYTVNEDGGKATVTVLKTGPAKASVSYATADGTARAGSDYTAASGQLTFNATDKSKTFTIPILKDATVEEPETVLLFLTNPSDGHLLGPVSTATLTIADVDHGGTIQFASANVSVAEALATRVAVLTVKRTGGAAGGVTVDYATSAGTATAGQDYAHSQGTLSFGAGQDLKTILIPLQDDALVEGPETFQVTLSNPTGGAALGTPAQSTVTLLDGDNGGTIHFSAPAYTFAEPNEALLKATITVTRTGTSLAGGVSVQYATSDGTAVAGADYVPAAGQLVFGPGESEKTIELMIRGDTESERDETIRLTLSAPQGGAALGTPSTAVVTIVDSGPSLLFGAPVYIAAEGSSATLTVVRGGPKTDTLIVRYATEDLPDGGPAGRSARAGDDYQVTRGLLTFGRNETSRTISVPVSANLDGPRSFGVRLSEPRNTAAGAATPGIQAEATVVTIVDLDAARSTVQFESPSYTVREGESVTIAVLRSGGDLGLRAVAQSNASTGTATARVDYTPAIAPLEFAPGVSRRTFTFTAQRDSLLEGHETVELVLAAGLNAVLGAQSRALVTILDANAAGTIELEKDAYAVSAGQAVTVTVKRPNATAPGATVRFRTDDGTAVAPGDYEAMSGVITFTGKTATIAGITVRTQQNAAAEADRTFRITLSDPQPGGNAVLGAKSAATVTITDTHPRLAFTSQAYTVTEGQTATIAVTRTGPKNTRVSVRYATPPDGGGHFEPASGVLTFESGDVSRTFTFATTSNAVVDGPRAVTLQLSDPVGAVLTRAQAVLTIRDDERAGTLQFNQPSHVIVEGKTAELAVTRTGTDGTVTVAYEVAGGTAVGDGVDYTLAAGTLTFAPGAARAVIQVPTVADGLPEGTETVLVRLATPGGGAVLGTPAATTLFIVDAEQTVAFSRAAYTVGETALRAVITVLRGGLPDTAVTVRVHSDDTATEPGSAKPGDDYRPVDRMLTFSAGQTTTTFEVEIPKTAVVRSGDRTLRLLLESAPDLLGTPSTATLTILDFQPDLLILTVRPPAAGLTGKLLATPLSVRNAGPVMAPTFQVGVYVSADDGTPEAALPGAGTLLLPIQTLASLGAGGSVELIPSLEIPPTLPPGRYFMSAVADFGRTVDETDEGNNAQSVSVPVRFHPGVKVSNVAATISQFDPSLATARFRGRVTAAGLDAGGCDAVIDEVSLTGSFQILSQIGPTVDATARLTGTFGNGDVTYDLRLTLSVEDVSAVTGAFKIESIRGAFSGTGTGTFTGTLRDQILGGTIGGTVNTSTGRVCNFSGTLRAAGDASFVLGFQQRAVGGRFAGAATPQLATPVSVSEFTATLSALFDVGYPLPGAVTFTGPAGSGLVATPASARRSEIDEAAGTADYVTPPIARAGGAPGGVGAAGRYAVRYKSGERTFEVPNPDTDRRLALAVPTVDVAPDTGLLTAVRWTWRDRNGPITVPPFVSRVRVHVTAAAGLDPLYLSPALTRGNTSHVLELPVLWEDAAELAMLYVDAVTGHEYRVAYPRVARAVVELGRERAVDKTGARDGEFLTVTYMAPAGTLAISPGAVRVSGGPFTNQVVPFEGQTGDPLLDVFRLRVDVTGSPPPPDAELVLTVTPIAGLPQRLVTSVRNVSTPASIDITNLTGTREADAMLGQRQSVVWTLPPSRAEGGFDVVAVDLAGIVRASDGALFCAGFADSELGRTATTGFVTLPATCLGRPVESARICVVIHGDGGEQTAACRGFGPDDIAVQFSRDTFSVTEGQPAKVTVTRTGPRRGDLTVDYATVAGGGATVVQDYEETRGTLTIRAGTDSASFSVPTVQDGRVEGDETVLLRLSNPGGGALLGVPSAAALTIVDDDDGGTIQFARAASGVVEGEKTSLTVTRALSRPGLRLAGNVTVLYEVVGGTAVRGADFVLDNGTLTFSADAGSQTIDVEAKNDTIAQGARAAQIRLRNPLGGATLGGVAETTLTIQDDDEGGVLQLVQPAQSKVGEKPGRVTLIVQRSGATARLAGNVSVDYRVGAGTTATAGSDFRLLGTGRVTFDAGDTSRPIEVEIFGDELGEGDETVVVELVNPLGGATLGPSTRATLTIEDDEQVVQFSAPTYQVTEGGAVTLTVVRTGPATGTVRVRFAAIGGTASGNDYRLDDGTLTFTKGQRSATFDITTKQFDDKLAEGDETIVVALSAPTPAGVVSLGNLSVATVLLVDNEQRVKFSASTYKGVEGQPASITVVRTGSAGTATVDYTATLGTTLVTSGTVTFPPNTTTRTFDVTLAADPRALAARSVTLRLDNPRNPTAGIALVSPSQATLTVQDVHEAGTIEFDAKSVAASEREGRTAKLTVVRRGVKAKLASSVLVDYRVVGGTAPGTDYTVQGSGTLTFVAEQDAASIEVTLKNDAAASGDRTVVIELSDARGGVGVKLGTRKATLTIVDDEQVVQFSAANYTVTESGSATVTVTRSGFIADPATVTYSSSNETASDADYVTPVSGRLTFLANVKSLTFSVTTRPDRVAEGNERVALQLASTDPRVLLGAVNRATLTIADDDQGGVIQFDRATYSVTESASGSLIVARAGTNLGSGVTVDYQVVGGNASSPAHYILANGTLTFGESVASLPIAVTTSGNTVVDDTRTVVVRLTNPRGGSAALGARTEATLLILDDDQGGVLEFESPSVSVVEGATASVFVTRAGTNLASGVVVPYQLIEGTAVAGRDYTGTTGSLTFGANVSRLPVQVPTKQNALADGARTLTVRLQNPTGGATRGALRQTTLTILDDEQEVQFRLSGYQVFEGGTAAIDVTRTGPATAAATVGFTTVAGTAVAGVDYQTATGTLTFAAGSGSATFAVTALQNGVLNASKTVTLQLTNPGPGVILGSRRQVTLTILDDENEVRFKASAASVTEGGVATIELTRSGPNHNPARVIFATVSGGSAVANVDYTPVSGFVTFAAGSSTASAFVTTMQNAVRNGTRTVVVRLTSPEAPAVLGSPGEATLTILDDDQTVQFSQVTYSVSEGDTVTLTLSRTGTPTGTVLVDFATADGTARAGRDYNEKSGTVTFGPGVTSRTFTVRALDDSRFDPGETFFVRLSNPRSAEPGPSVLLGPATQATVTIGF